jgi:cellulose synthase/poly-beta-1,6-N-acetylglucosamine synthase-like glycosyltransferase
MSANGRYAIITPYYKEDRFLIERCIASVRAQSIATEHIVVADGHPQTWIDGAGVRHLKLDRSHGDFGNTPRGIGALLAISEGYGGIGLLDADNWLEHDHVEACLAAAQAEAAVCDYVVALRTFRRSDATIMPVLEEQGHVDTNCYFFLRGAFCAIPHWAMMPKNLAPGGDRYFLAMMRSRPFVHAQMSRPTVNYLCGWESLYRSVGETPPPGAKPNIDATKVQRWLRSLDRRELEITGRLTGVSFLAGPAPPDPPAPTNKPRNAACPCGSGKRFKHCHGALA